MSDFKQKKYLIPLFILIVIIILLTILLFKTNQPDVTSNLTNEISTIEADDINIASSDSLSSDSLSSDSLSSDSLSSDSLSSDSLSSDGVPDPMSPIIIEDTELIESEQNTTSDPDSSPSSGSSDSIQRYVYKEGFYYEPLNENVKQRIYGLSYKEDCTIPYDDLRYLSLNYINFSGEIVTGELICNKLIADDLIEIFYELFVAGYQIDKIKLIDEYQADDDLSCADDNTSCFNYRVVEGSTNLSKHAMGMAIDINPIFNPYVTFPDGIQRVSPAGSEVYADRSLDFAHKINEADLCYQLFISHGFTWGGNWKTLKDYQHFQKSN